MAVSSSLCISISLTLPQWSCHVRSVVTCWVRPGALHCHQVRGESSSYSCLSLQCWGAAEWGQCKPGLTLPTFWLTKGSGGTLPPLTQLPCFYFFCPREHLKYFNHLKSFSLLRSCPVLLGTRAHWFTRAGEGETGDVGGLSGDPGGILQGFNAFVRKLLLSCFPQIHHFKLRKYKSVLPSVKSLSYLLSYLKGFGFILCQKAGIGFKWSIKW